LISTEAPPQARLGELIALPRLIAGFKGLTSKRKQGRGKEGKGKSIGERGREEAGRREKGEKRKT